MKPLHTLEIHLTDEQKKQTNIQLPFSFMVPYYVPHILPKRKCWIQTDVNIPYKLDPRDLDFIHVNAHPFVTKVNEVLTGQLGFQKTNREEVIYYAGFGGKWITNKKVLDHPLYPMISRSFVPMAQEIEYLPSPEFREKFKEVELIFDIYEDHTDLYVELQVPVSKEVGGYFQRAAILERNLDETIHKVSFTNEELSDSTIIAERLYDLFKHSQPPEELQLKI
ncbi:hypothetical protein F9802_02860 [Bacillus aerolatus]|uniref:Uncharacterized protein n=1 Tax=Bacillus aerolatus TaxID=2653354 RepID=A0A6I1FK51_9BACI|nr:sporulation protein [Bacillus aerolatus]KAB7709079.1 hypothetical protein F9802_02860 [Bacillus aerolatus]